MKVGEKMEKIFVNCGGSLYQYESKKEVMAFFEDCIYSSEGSERDRYTNIYFSVKEHLKDSKKCFTDGTSHIFDSNIDPDSITLSEEQELIKNFKINKEDLFRFKVRNYLSASHSRIYDSTLERYDSFDDLYNDYIKKQKEDSFFIIKDNVITCIDSTAKEPDNYFVEDFDLEDYEYADKWLKGEIEYEDYLKYKNEKGKNKEYIEI